jgi:hypothetical protein
MFPQIPNGDFEQWTGGEPDEWWTNNFTTVMVTQSSDAHGGSSAVRGDNMSVGGSILQPLLVSGLLGEKGFPVSQRYANVTGYYKFNVVGTDVFNILAAMFKDGQAIAVGGLQIGGASSYTLFTVPIYYSNGETPDSCQISVTIANNSGPVSLGSYFLMDDLLFQGTVTGIDKNSDEIPYNFALMQNYPNPFNPSTNLSFVIGNSSFISLKVYDILGNEVATLVNEEKPAGSYEISFDASNLAGGVYFYRLTAGNYSDVKKMMVMK